MLQETCRKPGLAFCRKSYYSIVQKDTVIRKALKEDNELRMLAAGPFNEIAISNNVLAVFEGMNI